LVSDAGMPGINDPGSSVISAAARNGIRVIPIPGPSAFLAALVASGLLGETFLYCGFVAAKSSQRKQQFKKYKGTLSYASLFMVHSFRFNFLQIVHQH
jgi:16S rRNA (cytidine1402-2'-O)-methyltransferase